MNRREALQGVTFLLGGAISMATASAILTGCKTDGAGAAAASSGSFNLNSMHKDLLSELAEVIIPKTDTPGAKDVGVGPFIEMMLNDCYNKVQQDHFVKGLSLVDELSKKVGGSFITLDNAKKIDVMKQLKEAAKNESEAQKEQVKVVDAESGLKKDDKKKEDPPVPFFNLLKELTVFGYFTSEQGAKTNLNYIPVPTKYEGCISATPQTKPSAL